MSRHFDLFDHRELELGPPRTSLGVKRRAGPRRSVLRLASVWRTELERVINRLYLLPESPRPRILVFLGAEPESNCTSVCAHIGDLLASSISAPVCLVEANPNAPSLERRLGHPRRGGLAELLASPDLELKSAAAQLPGGDLWLLPGGFAADSTAGLFSRSDRLLGRMNELRACFDFALIDAPPVRASRDALTLAHLSDGVVMILRATGARRDSSHRLKEDLEAAGVEILGAILADEGLSVAAEN
jgi:hypothetical protein